MFKKGDFMENNFNNANEANNIRETLNFILTLQKNSCTPSECEGCTRPFLGPNGNTVCYNTRPVTLFSCCTGELWTMPYILNGETGTSTVFRVENVEGNCATFRILIPTTVDGTTTYSLSSSFFTIDLSCVLALQCLSDAYVI